jgi:hypothetical protein
MNCDGVIDALPRPLMRHCCGAIRLIVELCVSDGNFALRAAEIVDLRSSFLRYKVVYSS